MIDTIVTGNGGSNPEAYLLNCWYQAGWSSELEDKPLARTLLDIPVVLFRTAEAVGAILDRCPHRFAPLSVGRVEDGAIACGYHGLAFNGQGRCVRNPHGPIVGGMQVRSFPVVERHCAIWIWMGEAALADPALIPDLSFIDDTPETARLLFSMPTKAGYRLMTDNIMDLSHADYLHASSLGGVITDAKTRVFKRNGGIVAEWLNKGCTAPGLFQRKVPSPAKADYWIEVEWHAPAVMMLGTAVVPAGQTKCYEDDIYALHSMTPETATESHYFVCATRRDWVDDAAFSAMLRPALEAAFVGEDKPMLEAQQRRMGSSEFWSLKPVLMQIDSASVQVRRALDALIAREQAEATTGSALLAAE